MLINCQVGRDQKIKYQIIEGISANTEYFKRMFHNGRLAFVHKTSQWVVLLYHFKNICTSDSSVTLSNLMFCNRELIRTVYQEGDMLTATGKYASVFQAILSQW